ncbi:MAG: hypothetical protein GX950_00745 [Candidatus Diapherotrites archaeon]|uniref:DUF296 domain-containing protein n=1 Tax=Candidatus Iainarchaeum sp. TaxID=3101447 RepID=A0A7K4BYN2_9ARCH|nr:hypothetical protein [Candidatus Diapherotrites archaeon]
MPAKKIDSMLIKEKIPVKILTLILDEGDDVMTCIKLGMQQNNIREAKVEDIEGFLLKGAINCMEGHKYKRIEVENIELLRASGNFKFGGEDLWGNLNIFTAGRKPISGTLHKGIAKDGLTIKLKFVP